MIKNFDTYINEDYFSKLANRKDAGDVRKENEITEDFVLSILSDTYKKPKSITIRKENGRAVVDIDGDFFLTEELSEIPFKFGIVTGNFNCTTCKLLTLEGCPNEVGGYFSCSYCNNLISFKGAPEYIGNSFICTFCKNLTSLEGCPKKVGGNFNCQYCGGMFTKDDIKSLCDVKGYIHV